MTTVIEKAPEELVEPPVVREIVEIIQNNHEFLIAGHLRPDGDCLGSCLGLYSILVNMGKKVRFYTHGPMPPIFSYLPNFDKIETTIPTHKPDIYLFVDSAERERVHDDFHPDGFVVNIDHHLSNTNYGNVNWVDTEASSAGEQIYRLALVLDQPITPEIATCLYTAQMCDTGGFRFSNTDTMTFHSAAHLVKCGADPAMIAEAVFDSRKPEQVRLTGEIYATLKYEFGGRLVWNEITRELFDRCGGDDAEPEGLSSDIRGIAGVDVAILFFETPEGFIRAGFRSKGKINVSELANMVGGGGHHNASGCFVKEPYQAARDRILGIARKYLSERFKN